MIEVLSAQCLCFACPTIYTGKTNDGCTIYARYRWGRLSVRIDPCDNPPHDGAEGRWIFERQLGDEHHGYLDYADLREHTTGLVRWPNELAEVKSDAEPIDPIDSVTL